MLGLGPTPGGAAVAAPHVSSDPLPGALLVLLGMSALNLLALMPGTFGVGWLTFALVGLPLAAGGAWGTLMGYAVFSTRIEIAPDGLVIAAPGWRACPFPPVRQHRLEWTDVRAVRHRTERYRVGLSPFRVRLEAYAIETTDGLVPFGSYYLSDLEPVLIGLAHRADRPWCEDDEVEAGLLRTVVFGAPAWPRVDPQPTV
jgi:hypothetical protein